MKPIAQSLLSLCLALLPCTIYGQIIGDTSVCEGTQATYYYTGPPATGFQWTTTGGMVLGTATADSLQMHWTNTGTGTLLLNVQLPGGGMAQHVLNIQVNPIPEAVIHTIPYPTCPTRPGGATGQPDEGDAGCAKVCKNATITYYTTPASGETVQWNVQGGIPQGSLSADTLSVMWDSTAFGQLTLITTNSFGCVDTVTLCIEKLDLPISAFTHQSNVCKFTHTMFTNLSTGATQYEWHFGDGHTSNAASPTHAYSNAGSYTVTLIAENDCHCTDTFSSVIFIDSLPGPEVSCIETVCAFDTATYTATADSNCTFNWFVQGGTIVGSANHSTVTIAWGAGQMGTLGLYLSGCTQTCMDTSLFQIPIVPATANISGPSVVCPGTCATYSLPKFSGATYQWELKGCGQIKDSSQCETVTICWPPFSGPCVDTLFVTYYDSFLHCGGKAAYLIYLRPELTLWGNTTVCANDNSTFGNFAGISCHWSISPSGPSLSTSPAPMVTIDWNGQPGTYVLTAIPDDSTASCSAMASLLVNVIAPPSTPAIQGDTLVCPGSSVNYCVSTPHNVFWHITGGTPTSSIGNCMTVQWGNSPPYIVQAITRYNSNPACQSDTATLHVFPYSATTPVINGPDTVCANSTTTFALNNALPTGTAFTWQITPGNAGSILSPGSATTAIEWGNNAPQTVSIQCVIKICGDSSVVTKTLYLQSGPTPTITQTGLLCDNGGTVNLSTTGTYSAINWSGPSGFTGSGTPITISQPGWYYVNVTDINGCQGQGQHEVFTVSAPDASISTPDNLVHCLGTAFLDTLCALGNPNYQYAWSNGGTTQCITTSTPGTYQVTITDLSNNCVDISNTLTVSQITCGGQSCQPLGTANFTFSGCNPITFTNTSSGALFYTWSFGDGQTSSATNPTHTYTQAGFYHLILNAYVPGVNGDTCVVRKEATVEVPLSAKFDVQAGCLNAPVCFTDMSTTTAGTNITSWQWNFGDANTSAVQHPCHTYANPGTYTVTLTISDGTCNSSVSKTLTIDSLPTAAFSFPQPGCENTPILFSDLSFSNINAWSWQFGDGGTSLNASPYHTFQPGGSYPVSLAVQDLYGCKDTLVQTAIIHPNTLSGIITAKPDSVVCDGQTITLAAPGCSSCTYQWSNGNNQDSIVVTKSGIYAVTITDSSGCTYSDYIYATVLAPIPARITNVTQDEFCLGSFASLSTPNNPNYAYLWHSNDTNSDSTTFPSVFFNPTVAGSYYFQVTVVDTSTGCSQTSLPYNVEVYPNPPNPVILPGGPTTVCEGTPVTLVGQHTNPAMQLSWSTGEVSDTIVVMDNGCYTLIATDTNGCTSDTTICITVNPMPELCAFYEGCYDTCRPYIIEGPGGGSQYQWLYNGTPIATNGQSQNYSATQSGLYSLVVTNNYGCTDTTGQLDLTLYDCHDSLCAELIIDSMGCDTNGNHLLYFKVVNHSNYTISQTFLSVLPPFTQIPYAPHSYYPNLSPGDTSMQLTTTLYQLQTGDSVCFQAQLSAFTAAGHELLCCLSDTVCYVVPDCGIDSSCCEMQYLKEDVTCKQTSVGTQYFFDLVVEGCGTLQISSTNPGALQVNNPYQLTGGIHNISGSYVAMGVHDTLLCLTLTLYRQGKACRDTTVCIPIRCGEHPLPCQWRTMETICEGQTATYQYTGNPSGITFSWTFTGGNPSTASGPGPHFVNYPTAGSYPVSLQMTNANGITVCSDTIEVVAAPVASITQTGATLFAQPPGMTYQWYQGQPPAWTPINGAINQHYSPSQKEGRYCVVVISREGCRDTACIDFIYTGVEALAVSEWQIHPNPNDGGFTVSLTTLSPMPVQVTLTNMYGQLVDQRQWETNGGQQSFRIDNRHFSPGMYTLHLKYAGGYSTKMMVVQH